MTHYQSTENTPSHSQTANWQSEPTRTCSYQRKWARRPMYAADSPPVTTNTWITPIITNTFWIITAKEFYLFWIIPAGDFPILPLCQHEKNKTLRKMHSHTSLHLIEGENLSTDMYYTFLFSLSTLNYLILSHIYLPTYLIGCLI